MQIPSFLMIPSCEKALANLAEEEVGDLTLPAGTKKFAFAGIASAVQLALTWGRRSSTRSIELKGTSAKVDERIRDVLNQPHKFVAAMFSRSVKIKISGEYLDLKRNLNLSASEKIDQQNRKSFGNQRGRLCWFCFVDHSTKGFDRNFYHESPSGTMLPRQAQQIESVIRSMVQKSSRVAGRSTDLPEDDSVYLGRMFYELFLNTHEHGSRDKHRDIWLRPGVRLIYTYGINLTEVAVRKALTVDSVVGSYIESLNLGGLYIEISIVDSGIGLVNRWQADRGGSLRDEINLNVEYDIVKKCFSFRESSFNRTEKGNGLPIVMDRLTKLQGFMRIRSGRLALYRNFVNNPYRGNGDTEFYDWESTEPASKSLTEMSSVEGTAVTLLVPLAAKE